MVKSKISTDHTYLVDTNYWSPLDKEDDDDDEDEEIKEEINAIKHEPQEHHPTAPRVANETPTPRVAIATPTPRVTDTMPTPRVSTMRQPKEKAMIDKTIPTKQRRTAKDDTPG